VPDAWERFERFLKQIPKGGPQHGRPGVVGDEPGVICPLASSPAHGGKEFALVRRDLRNMGRRISMPPKLAEKVKRIGVIAPLDWLAKIDI
jgi:hypothetical protein